MSKHFRQQDSQFHKKLGTKWRKANGRQSKMRKSKRGAGFMPAIGYRGSKATRYMVQGVHAPFVFNAAAVTGMKGVKAIRIPSGVGKKKLLEIEAKAKEAGIRILNASRVKKAGALAKAIEAKKKAVIKKAEKQEQKTQQNKGEKTEEKTEAKKTEKPEENKPEKPDAKKEEKK